MKKLLPFLLLAGCVHKPLPPIPAPSVGAVKYGISQAQSQLTAAQTSADAIEGHLTAARTKAQRINDKAVVVLENLP